MWERRDRLGACVTEVGDDEVGAGAHPPPGLLWALPPETQTQVLKILNTSQAALPVGGAGMELDSRNQRYSGLQAAGPPPGKLNPNRSVREQRAGRKEGGREGTLH